MSKKRRVHRRKKGYSSNPIFRGGGNFVATTKRTVKEGAVGAVGAIGMDLAWGYGSAYLPDFLKAGYAKYLSKGLLSVLVGMLGGRVLKGQANVLAVGGMTVALHDALKEALMGAVPALPLSEYLAYSPGSGQIVGTYGDQGLGALPDLSSGMNSLGFNSFETDTLGEYLTEY